MKTSRFFLLHSDDTFKDNIAILDTHILKFVRENIDNSAPTATPTNSNTYKLWEDKFLFWCTENKKNTAEFDLEVWKSYARKNKEVSESE
jgi:thermostable 8-oxoguanine DNA glycosylase